ncbi:MAG: hypothetical protein ACREPD_15535 [Stenotrophomonas sp.]|uniref:hypothetical protein n=1 Tax=Stenotrophomonas sp. TaxID=69392 RepID=UPI003D6D830E
MSSYCQAITFASSTPALSVREVYVYGTMQHGSILISPSCVRPVFTFYSFQDSVSPASGAADRIRKFNQSVYNSPARASGLFKIDAVLNIYPDSRLVELYDINDFREVDDAETRQIIGMLRKSRR